MTRKASSGLALCLAVAACDGETYVTSDGSTSSGQAVADMRVTLSDGTEVGTPEMLVTIREPSNLTVTPVEVIVLGGLGKHNWQAMWSLDHSMLLTGEELRIEVRDAPDAILQGNVKRFPLDGKSDRDDATSGTIRVTLESSRPYARGIVEVVPDSLSASFAGRFRTICLKASSDGTAYQEDESFSSPFCQQFAAWKP